MNLVIKMFSSKYMDTPDNFEHFKGITWSPYERIEVRTVNSFKDMCMEGNFEGKGAYKWIGVKQCLHLIGISEDIGFALNENNEGNFVFNTPDEVPDYNFYCILSVRFDALIHRLQNAADGQGRENIIKAIKNESIDRVRNELKNIRKDNV